MSATQSIQSLLAAAHHAADDALHSGSPERCRGAERQGSPELCRRAARILWARRQIEALQEAHKRLDAAWARPIILSLSKDDALPDDLSDEALEAMNIPDLPEQAEVDAIYDELAAVRDRGMWPRELYWSV